MFMARRKRWSGRDARAEQPASRAAARLSTLARRYDFHRGEAMRAELEGSHDKATKHSGTALRISRELYAVARDPAQHQPELAAALCAHAPYNGTSQAIAMLTESAGLYAGLAAADAASYEVPRIDVLTRVALAIDAAGATRDAIDLLREIVGMYIKAPVSDTGERDVGLARARFHLGYLLLKTGMAAEGLAETDTGLELAADVLDRLAVLTPTGPDGTVGWLTTAPRHLQLVAPEWAAAAVRSMILHADAGRWPQAATSARAAVLVSGGLAALGAETLRDAHSAICAKARSLSRAPGEWGDGQFPHAQGGSGGDRPPEGYSISWSTKRLRERSTSASAAARSAQCEPSTDLPGSRSL